MSALISKPTIDAPPPPPPPPTAKATEADDEAQRRERRRAAKGGRASTLLTGPRGLDESANGGASRSLLGI